MAATAATSLDTPALPPVPSNSGRFGVPAARSARCAPAEWPWMAILVASIPSSSAFARIQRMAAFTSWMWAGHGDSGVRRYSPATQTKPVPRKRQRCVSHAASLAHPPAAAVQHENGRRGPHEILRRVDVALQVPSSARPKPHSLPLVDPGALRHGLLPLPPFRRPRLWAVGYAGCGSPSLPAVLPAQVAFDQHFADAEDLTIGDLSDDDRVVAGGHELLSITCEPAERFVEHGQPFGCTPWSISASL